VTQLQSDASAVCAAIDDLFDAVADYHTIIRPSEYDFAILAVKHAKAAAVVEALGVSLPPIDEAGLPVFVEWPLPGGGSSYHTAWRTKSIFSPERHDRWRRKVREARRRAELAALKQSGEPRTEQPVGFDTRWPFGMLANLAERRVRRGDKEADFGSNKPTWQALVKLARNYPSRMSAQALWSSNDTTELGSVYTAISTLRRLLAPLGIHIPHAGRRGYVLAELPPRP
jgi:hypothetical protein